MVNPAPAISAVCKRVAALTEQAASVVVHGNSREALLSNEALSRSYNAAKYQGDIHASVAWAKAALNEAALEKIAAQAGEAPIIVPVIGRERQNGSVNRIPLGFAHVLQERFGWIIDPDIVKKQMFGRTELNTAQRLTHQPEFDGRVLSGKNYIVVDDHLTLGGTIRNLCDHIQSNGGNVTATSVLFARHPQISLIPTQKQATRLMQMDGGCFGQFHKEFFGRQHALRGRVRPADIYFTGPEAGLIIKYEGGIAELRRALAGSGVGPGSSVPYTPGSAESVVRVGERHAAGAQRPFVRAQPLNSFTEEELARRLESRNRGLGD